MIPSSAQVAENVRKHVGAMAYEIGRRVAASQGAVIGAITAVEAERVLLDWFLGDWLPPANENARAPAELSAAADSAGPQRSKNPPAAG